MKMIRLSALTLALCISGADSLVVDDNWKTVCHNHCHEDGDPVIHNTLMEFCDAYKNMLPKPRVYRICSNAFEHVLDKECANLCGGGSHSRSRMENHGNQWCKKHKKSLPKPGSHDACIQGAHAGAIAAHKYVSFLKKEYARKLEEEPEETKQEIIKEMELAAELEEQQVHKASSSGQAVVVEEVRAQAEAAVEEIKEEVKEGKTDLDLAREAARAAFKAKQASEEEAVEEIDL